MTLTETQIEAFNALVGRLPEDTVPPYIPPGTSKPAEPNKWVEAQKKVAKQGKEKAASNYNLRARKDRPNRDKAAPTRILSPEMFPADITVSYLDAPRLGYMAPSKPRTVKFIVFHSYGRYWHASETGKSGWLNSKRPGMGAVTYYLMSNDVRYESGISGIKGSNTLSTGQRVGIARGTDPATLSHPDKVSAIIQSVVGPNSRTCYHYMIDRVGNLTVIGDANFVMFSSDYANEFAISIALEEAFYILKPVGEDPARYSTGGTPPGTAGNIKYFSFSPAQLLTLSVLCRKLEVAFGIPQTVSISRRSLSANSPPGYTMHDFIRGSSYIDVSPQFVTQAMWDDFFKLVNTHTGINETNVWQPIPKYTDSSDELITAPITDYPANRATEIAIENSRYMGLGKSRAISKANADKNALNSEAGKIELATANELEKQAVSAHSFAMAEENLPVSLVQEDMAPEDQGGWDDIWLKEI